MNILVLGSAGQIGSHLVSFMKTKGHNVIEYDIKNGYDLRVPQVLDSILPDIDFVFFLAFDVGGSMYLKQYQDTYEFISNNIKIMDNVFDSLRLCGTPFVFASSQMVKVKNSSYGILKSIGEKYTKSLCTGVIARLWNVYGYERDFTKSHIITDCILMAKNDGVIKLKTTGEELRQFLYADDCCEFFETLIHTTPSENEYDVSSFEWRSIYDVASIVANYYSCKVIVGNGEDEVQQNLCYAPNNKILQWWRPKISIYEGIEKLINIYQ